MILFLIPSRSLRVYVFKQLFFLVSLNSGVSNFYLATIHLDFKEYLIRLLKKLGDILTSSAVYLRS